MIIETKYNIGDTVWQILKEQDRVFEPCGACDGTGRVQLTDGIRYSCPACKGNKGSYTFVGRKWLVKSRLTIGQIRVHVGGEEEERYMMHETGINSGTLYNGATLFGSEESAQAECDRRNNDD